MFRESDFVIKDNICSISCENSVFGRALFGCWQNQILKKITSYPHKWNTVSALIQISSMILSTDIHFDLLIEFVTTASLYHIYFEIKDCLEVCFGLENLFSMRRLLPRINQWASCKIRKIAGWACAGKVGKVFPATDFCKIDSSRSRHASLHVSRACRDHQPAVAGKTFPAFPVHAQPAILRIWYEAHWLRHGTPILCL